MSHPLSRRTSFGLSTIEMTISLCPSEYPAFREIVPVYQLWGVGRRDIQVQLRGHWHFAGVFNLCACDFEIPNSSATSRIVNPSSKSSAAREPIASSRACVVQTSAPVGSVLRQTSKGFAFSPSSARHFSKCTSHRSPWCCE